MSTFAGRTTAALLRAKPAVFTQQANFSLKSKTSKNIAWVVGSLAVGGGVVTAAALATPVLAGDPILHPAKMHWSHSGWLDTYDHASIRRGYEVYKQVCAACHSMEYMHYRNLVGVIFTEEEAKAEAEEAQVEDGPNDDGDMFLRPGKLSDKFPSPYKNEQLARNANNGALPPDLSLICLARHGGEDYIFSLLTGYSDAPAGVQLMEGQHYNAYFQGGAIGMAQALYNEIIEYSDGTPATQSQLAKDISTFLKWAGERDQDKNKLYGLRGIIVGLIMLSAVLFLNRQAWSTQKTAQLAFRPPVYKKYVKTFRKGHKDYGMK